MALFFGTTLPRAFAKARHAVVSGILVIVLNHEQLFHNPVREELPTIPPEPSPGFAA